MRFSLRPTRDKLHSTHELWLIGIIMHFVESDWLRSLNPKTTHSFQSIHDTNM